MTARIGSSAYVNLPVTDLAATRAFWEQVGVRISENYSDDNALSLSFSEHVVVMLLTHDFYAQFLDGRPIADTRAQNGAIVCLDAASKEDVDAFVDAAVTAGARELPPAQAAADMVEAGLMYGRTFSDPDGHLWEILWMSAEMPAG